jgi:hypothetical protein
MAKLINYFEHLIATSCYQVIEAICTPPPGIRP